MNFHYGFSNSKEIFKGIFSSIEKWCLVFNQFILIFFIFMKYIFVFILFSLGFLTLFKLRRVYFDLRCKGSRNDKDPLKKERLILGFTYIFLGVGFLFNFLTIFLIWVLDPLPDRVIFKFLNFNGGINPEYMNRVEDIEASKYPHERTIYYCFALVSFYGLLNLIISIWFFLHNRSMANPRNTLILMIESIIIGILFGFTTSLPFFL